MIFDFFIQLLISFYVSPSRPVGRWSSHPGCPIASWAQTLAPGWRSDRPPPSPSWAGGLPGGSGAPSRSAAGTPLLWTPETPAHTAVHPISQQKYKASWTIHLTLLAVPFQHTICLVVHQRQCDYFMKLFLLSFCTCPKQANWGRLWIKHST